jgi:glutathione synthase/RimK-type ligase-like ATP-grasp enzyme
MTILILGGFEDEHACHVHTHLRERGFDVEMLDSRWFPSSLGITFDPATQSGAVRLPEGRVLRFDEVQSVYWRCYNNVSIPPLADEGQAFIAGNDARSLFETFLIRLPARWVNGWEAFQLHQTKPVQLAQAAELGLSVPETILTNDPEAVRDFVARHPRSIFKPVQGGAHTQRVGPAHLTEENLGNLRYAPVTLQEEVAGTNIRVFVAGQEVMACEVKTDSLDFRDDADPTILEHALPGEVVGQARGIARKLNLLWTGIDFRLTPHRSYIFLEANPSPMFLGFEARCGLPLTRALAGVLTQAGPPTTKEAER